MSLGTFTSSSGGAGFPAEGLTREAGSFKPFIARGVTVSGIEEGTRDGDLARRLLLRPVSGNLVSGRGDNVCRRESEMLRHDFRRRGQSEGVEADDRPVAAGIP